MIKHLLNMPDHLRIYDTLLVGRSGLVGEPSPILLRPRDEMVHYDRAGDDEFLSEEELRRQIDKLRRGNVGRHREADHARG